MLPSVLTPLLCLVHDPLEQLTLNGPFVVEFVLDLLEGQPFSNLLAGQFTQQRPDAGIS